MLSNFIRIALRNIFKNGLYSLINVAGLAIGIVCSILILLWVSDELSFDKFHPKSDRLHQVWTNSSFNGKINSWISVPLPTYEEMKVADHKIVNSVVTGWGGDHLLTFGDERILERGYYVSEEFLEMFEFPLIAGDPSVVLDEPKSIVLTESFAKSIFGDADPINQIIRANDEGDLKVTGILKDIPNNSSFQFEFLMTWKYRESVNEWVVDNKDNWGNSSFQVFVELAGADDKDVVEGSIKEILMEKDGDDMRKEFFLHPMTDWRLNSNFENGVATGGSMDFVKLFSVIAVFILVIACINFMNLATARSERRAKEVGIRKSMGSSRFELIFQFLGESIFISLISYAVAVLIAILVLPYYNTLVEKELFIDFTSAIFWQYSLLIILVTGFISGSYPAFYLSSFQPAATLKGKVKVGKNASTPRKVLVTIQFGFSILLMIGTLVIFQQIKLVKNRELGYDQNNLISVYNNEELSDNYEVLKTELLASDVVEGVTRSNSEITNISSNNFLSWPGKPEDLRVIFTTIVTEYDYASTMGIEVLMGRDFSRDFASDSSAIIINMTALELMELDEPIGTQLDLWGDKRTLIGVVDDVLMGSPYTDVKPLFMIMDDWGGAITLRLKKGRDVQESLASVKTLFEKHNPAYPFDYRFADVVFQRKFNTIKLTQQLASIFAILAIIITGLGLFGLASYMAEQRTKEIGIRKVLGASVPSLIALISRDFSRLVILAFVISAPLSWWFLDNYLDRYPIRTEVSWWVFPLVGLVALIFSLLIVSNQARKAARANPVKSLRSE